MSAPKCTVKIFVLRSHNISAAKTCKGHTSYRKMEDFYLSKNLPLISVTTEAQLAMSNYSGDRRKFCVIDVPRQYENLRLSQE